MRKGYNWPSFFVLLECPHGRICGRLCLCYNVYMEFLLGIVTGLVSAVFVGVVLLYLKTPLERTIAQTQSRIKQKGAILAPQSNDLENFVNSLPHDTI